MIVVVHIGPNLDFNSKSKTTLEEVNMDSNCPLRVEHLLMQELIKSDQIVERGDSQTGNSNIDTRAARTPFYPNVTVSGRRLAPTGVLVSF